MLRYEIRKAGCEAFPPRNPLDVESLKILRQITKRVQEWGPT